MLSEAQWGAGLPWVQKTGYAVLLGEWYLDLRKLTPQTRGHGPGQKVGAQFREGPHIHAYKDVHSNKGKLWAAICGFPGLEVEFIYLLLRQSLAT